MTTCRVEERTGQEPDLFEDDEKEKECKRLNAEQRALDREIDRALYTRCGYGHGPVTQLSKAEIERVKGTITPIEQIPTPDVVPWALKGVVF